MGDVVTLPTLPAPTGDPFLDELELLVVRMLLDRVDHPHRGWPVGLARARELYLHHHPDLGSPADPGRFLQVTDRAVRLLSPSDRSRLRHPACTRAHAHRLLEKTHHGSVSQPAPR